MKLYQVILGYGAAIALAGTSFIGMSKLLTLKHKTIEGIVEKEFGTASTPIEFREDLFQGESLKMGDLTYGLVIRNEQGEYVMSVYESSTKPLIALAQAIEPGDKVRIIDDLSTSISVDRIGTMKSSSLSVIEKAKK